MTYVSSDNYKENIKRKLQELKTHVGVTDVALKLGYRIDKRAGVGRYVEMVLGTSGSVADRIIVSHPSDKAQQTFFRRDGSRGDVVTLIKDNLAQFHTTGSTEWSKVINALASMANMPPIDYDDTVLLGRSNAARAFNPDLYNVEAFTHGSPVPWMVKERGISQSTFEAFLPFIVKIRDIRIENFKGFNIGFPYRKADSDTVEGYEIRGAKGFKSKATGTNSSSAAWIADFSDGNPAAVKNVFFVESAYDAMGFYQANRFSVDWDTSVLVSLGGGTSGESMKNILTHYNRACAVDAFDNDLAGRNYGKKLFEIANALNMSDPADQKHCTETRKAPDVYKDWNDVILGKRMEAVILPSKHDRNAALTARREQSIKL